MKFERSTAPIRVIQFGEGGFLLTSPFPLHLHREAARLAVAERNGKKLADGQLLLELFRHRIVEQPVERQVDGDFDAQISPA